MDSLTQLFHHFVVEVGSIISNDPLRNTVSTDDLVLDKPGNHLLGDVGVGGSFYPLGEKIDGNKDEAVGSMRPIISMPHIAKGQGDVMTFRSEGGTFILSA